MTAQSPYVKHPTGIWLPPITTKQFQVFNNFSRFLLLTGPRLSTKTAGGVHKIMRHCFDCNGAVVAMVSKTIKAAKSAGTWVDLTEFALPKWLESDIGMKLTVPPKVSGDTRMTYFRVSNRFGTESEVQLHSVEHDKEVETKFKNSRYTMFYFIEADAFKERNVFDTTVTQLRSFIVPYDQMQWIGDTNPAEEGTAHWLYQLFYEYKDRPNRDDPHFDEDFHRCFDRIEFTLDDNPFMPDKERNILKSTYRSNRNRYARYIDGKWEADTGKQHFADSFDVNIHVLGDMRQREQIVPAETCKELIVGLDLGDINHSGHILDKIEVQEDEKSPVLTHFLVIDELVSTNLKITIREFIEAFMELVEKWEAFCQKNYKRQISFRTWSDNSAWRFRAAAEANDALIVRETSLGKLVPNAAPKYNYSVRHKVRIINQLLVDKRLFVSAQLTKTIAMFQLLRKGSSPTEYVKQDEHKHPFDSLGYVIHAEAPVDLLTHSQVKVQQRSGRLVLT